MFPAGIATTGVFAASRTHFSICISQPMHFETARFSARKHQVVRLSTYMKLSRQHQEQSQPDPQILVTSTVRMFVAVVGHL
jgi:hypothetical protein